MILTAIILSGCDKNATQMQSDSSPPSATATGSETATPHADPVGEFKMIARSFVPRAVAAYNGFLAEEGEEWVYTASSNVEFDVQKTDSLISPFTGDIHASGTWDTKSELGTLPVELTFLFAYQDGVWVPRSGSFRGTFPSGQAFTHEITNDLLVQAMPATP